MKSSEIIKITNAKIIQNCEQEFEIKISTDTRTIQKGDFYIPLKGPSFDGENFIKNALEKGACGAFVTKKIENIDTELLENKLILQVPDTLVAYLQLANFRRNSLNPVVVAITGSSGKTTTKELVTSVLKEKYNVFKTPLNHNNEVGFCQTIFEMPDNTEVLVLEMGMRGLGEIELLSKYAEPDYTIITNVGTAHIGILGSRENIAKAKCEIVKHQRGNTFIAKDDELIKKTVQFNGEKLFYSINDVKILKKNLEGSEFLYNNNIYNLNVAGDYNIENSLSAILLGQKLNLSIKKIQDGLQKYKQIEKRWEESSVNGFKFINDSYNANPESMRAFINTIFELYKNYVIILGDMGELGKNEVKFHQELGDFINTHKKLSPDALILSVGILSKNITDKISNCKTFHFNNIEDIVEYINKNIPKSRQIFLKASRSMKLEQIISKAGEC